MVWVECFIPMSLPKYGISVDEVDKVIRRLELIASTDAFVIVGGPKDQVKFAIDAIIQRLRMAVDGAPSETRERLWMVKPFSVDQGLGRVECILKQILAPYPLAIQFLIHSMIK